jgi:hypothetical protein
MCAAFDLVTFIFSRLSMTVMRVAGSARSCEAVLQDRQTDRWLSVQVETRLGRRVQQLPGDHQSGHFAHTAVERGHARHDLQLPGRLSQVSLWDESRWLAGILGKGKGALTGTGTPGSLG